MTLNRFAAGLVSLAVLAPAVWAQPIAPVAGGAERADGVVYKVLATNKTKTIEKEMNEAAAAGYEFSATMTGPTLGGKEVVVVMSKRANASPDQRNEYRLLATSKTSTQ